MSAAVLGMPSGDPVAVVAAVLAVVSVSALTPGRRARGRIGSDGTGLWPEWEAPPAVVDALHRSAVAVDPGRAFWTWVGAAGLAVAAIPVLAAGPMVAMAVIAGPPLALVATRHRRVARRRRHLPIALDTVASALRSGQSVGGALAEVADRAGPLADELAEVAARAGAGGRLGDVIADWASAGDADTRLAGAALVTAAELGGPAATALETTAQSLRDRVAADGVVDALSVQARLSALLLAVAPVGFAALMAGIDPTAARFLFHTPAGWLCLAGGLGLDIAGAIWMQRLVRRAR